LVSETVQKEGVGKVLQTRTSWILMLLLLPLLPPLLLLLLALLLVFAVFP